MSMHLPVINLAVSLLNLGLLINLTRLGRKNLKLTIQNNNVRESEARQCSTTHVTR